MSLRLISVLCAISVCACERILIVTPSPSYSHQVVYQPIWRELALKGHDVVVVTPNPINDPKITNLHEIDTSSTYEIWRNRLQGIISSNAFEGMKLLSSTFQEVTIANLKHPEVSNIIKNKSEHFDLVMVEYHLRPLLAFKVRFKCPIVVISSMDCVNSFHRSLGNVAHPFLTPDMFLDVDPNDGFFSKLAVFVVSTLFDVVLWKKAMKVDDGLVEKYFRPGYPPLSEMRENIDLAIINTNPIVTTPRLVDRNTIIINGGIHIQMKKPLPRDLEKFMSGSKKGVIYFSLGSNVKSENIPAETKRILLKVFSELQYDVLWKFEADELPGKPDNVKIMKWVPQQDVLRHPNVKLFITQGGLQSLEEALFSYVPMIGIPFFADQMFNAKKIKSKGLGLVVENYNFMTEEELKEKILEVIENPKYRNKVKELAILVKDEPMTALEKAVWWTEYVLRHKGAKHLKGPTLPFVQYYYLDILAFLALVFSIILYINYRIIKKCCSLCRSKPKQKEQ